MKWKVEVSVFSLSPKYMQAMKKHVWVWCIYATERYAAIMRSVKSFKIYHFKVKRESQLQYNMTSDAPISLSFSFFSFCFLKHCLLKKYACRKKMRSSLSWKLVHYFPFSPICFTGSLLHTDTIHLQPNLSQDCFGIPRGGRTLYS